MIWNRNPGRGALMATLLMAGCAQGPTAPTRQAASATPAVGTGTVQGSAAGDVQTGPIEIELVRVAQTDGVNPFYAFANGVYSVLPGREVEIYIQIWRSNPPVQSPRLVVDWGFGEPDNIHCGPCRLTKTYKNEGLYTVTVKLDDRVGGVTTRTFTLNVATPQAAERELTFSNPTPIIIPGDNVPTITATRQSGEVSSSGAATDGPADPYPSVIEVSGITGKIGSARVTIFGLSHTYPADMIVLLVSPSGRAVALMDDVGNGEDAVNANVTFEDGAPPFPSTAVGPGSYTFAPSGSTGYEAYPPAPATPYADTLSVLNGDDPNGSWRLYVGDYASGDSGQFAGGWSLTLTTAAGSSSGGIVIGAGAQTAPPSGSSPTLRGGRRQKVLGQE